MGTNVTIAIIGGSGFNNLDAFDVKQQTSVDTPYGKPSADILTGRLFDYDQDVLFIARHGENHSIQPHKINYRANIYALKELGVKNIVALAAVGGIDLPCEPGTLIVPHQILDYTYGREMTFFDQPDDVAHAEFTEPYSSAMRSVFIQAAEQLGLKIVNRGVYAATQGPRFETAAEIQRYQRDGATIVGMTGMPEAILARELGLGYMTIALSVNCAAGIQPGLIEHDDIHASYMTASRKLYTILKECLPQLSGINAEVPELIRV